MLPTSFLYFFQLLNNWPRALVFVWDNAVTARFHEIPITVTRPRVSHDGSNYYGFVNSLDDFRLYNGLVLLSVCESITNVSKNTIHWETTVTGEPISNFTTTSCAAQFIAPHQGQYSIHVTVRNNRSEIVAIGSARVLIRDVWVAAIGDSYTSGEGNPDEIKQGERSAKWINARCHQSARSWAYKLYEEIASTVPAGTAVHFSYLACTGTKVQNGLLGGNNNQMEIIEKITRERQSGPDILMMSVGGNDVGYAEVLHDLERRDVASMLRHLDARFYYVTAQLHQVRAKLAEIGVRQVLVPPYFDISKNEHGEVDADCTELRKMSTTGLEIAERTVLRRLNDVIMKVGQEGGWIVDERILDIFRYGGICSRQSLIRGYMDSIRLQGDPLGAFHPNEEAHEQIAKMLFPHVHQF